MLKKICALIKSKLDENTEKYGQRSTKFLINSMIFWLVVVIGMGSRLIVWFLGY